MPSFLDFSLLNFFVDGRVISRNILSLIDVPVGQLLAGLKLPHVSLEHALLSPERLWTNVRSCKIYARRSQRRLRVRLMELHFYYYIFRRRRSRITRYRRTYFQTYVIFAFGQTVIRRFCRLRVIR